jgi:hypothetical protein
MSSVPGFEAAIVTKQAYLQLGRGRLGRCHLRAEHLLVAPMKGHPASPRAMERGWPGPPQLMDIHTAPWPEHTVLG